MRVNSAITIFHFDEESGAYVRAEYPGVSAHKTLSDAPRFLIRIPTADMVSAEVGDTVCFGICGEIDPSACVKIVGAADRRRGANPHWRIVCI